MATAHLIFQTQPIKPTRRRCRETTITTSPATSGVCTPHRVDTPVAVSPDSSGSKPPASAAASPSPSSGADLKISNSPAAMESYNATPTAAIDQLPSSFSKFNSALTAGLLSPPPLGEKARSSPTLFEMMANETDSHPRATTLVQNGVFSTQSPQASKLVTNPPPPQDKQAYIQRMTDLLQSRSPGNQFNDAVSSDVKLNLSSKDGIRVSVNLHRQILVAHCRFFASKLNEDWSKQPNSVDISDCDDIEVYIETLRLLYCRDIRKKLRGEDVPRVLGILKVSAAIGFDAGVLSCLEYLEASPWAEDEEEKVASLLSELRLEGVGAGEVLKRVSVDVKSGNEEILLKLLHVVLEGKDEKARREMKNLVTKMLRENPSQNDLRKESLYSACDGCLKLLRHHFLTMEDVHQIARQSDNLHWLLDILIDRQIAEDFLKTWGLELELSEAHSKVPVVHRYEISRVTGRLFVGIGKGQVLASKETRCLLLKTWLVPFYDDFGWMRRASRGFDRCLVEEGLSSTILTLPMSWQQEIMLSWFNRFANSGDDCPNIQRGFEVWWRRAFWRRDEVVDRSRSMQIIAPGVENS